MKNSRAPKIVIGLGLLAVYAAILSTLILREGRPVAVAADAPGAPQEYIPPEPLAAADVATPLADPVSTAAEAPVAAPVPAAVPAEQDNVIASTTPARPAVPVRKVVASAPVEISTTSTTDASWPETASTANEAPPAAPASEAAADTHSEMPADVNQEDVSPLVVGN